MNVCTGTKRKSHKTIHAYGKCNIRRILPNCLFLIKWEKCSRYWGCVYNVILFIITEKNSTFCVVLHRLRLPAFPTWFLLSPLRYQDTSQTLVTNHISVTIYISPDFYNTYFIILCGAFVHIFCGNRVYHWQCFVVNPLRCHTPNSYWIYVLCFLHFPTPGFLTIFILFAPYLTRLLTFFSSCKCDDDTFEWMNLRLLHFSISNSKIRFCISSMHKHFDAIFAGIQALTVFMCVFERACDT